MSQADQELLKSLVRTIPNYPKEGIMFRDITTLIKSPEGFQKTIDLLYERYKDRDIDAIAGIEARGFILGAALAYKMKKGFIPIRKKGKLPGEVISEEYELEYGTDTIEVHLDAIDRGGKVLLVDDLLATGGTAMGAIRLIETIGAHVQECAFVIDLPDLGGRKKITTHGHEVFTIIEFEGD